MKTTKNGDSFQSSTEDAHPFQLFATKKLKQEKQKQRKNQQNPSHLPMPQHAPTSSEHDDTESKRGVDKALNDGTDKDLTDGKYKKAYVETFNGQTISIQYDPLDTVDSAKEQISRKTYPKRTAASCESRKSPEGQLENRRLQRERRGYN